MFNAVVVAGGGKPEILTEQEGVSNKAFIKIHGRPLLAYILAALEGAPSVERIIVVGPVEELEDLRLEGYNFEVVPEKKTSMLDNLAAGLEVVDQDRLSLIVTGDIPLLTAAVIEEFLTLCSPHDLEFYYPVLTREDCLQRFPETERTYVSLKDGYITGGNIGLISTSWFLANRSRLELFISYRKKPIKLLRILPFSLFFKHLRKTLAVSDLETSLSKLLKLKARAIFCSCVEIGVDVDKVSDLEVVKKALQPQG
jgi:CTP:molybdopterin cytidylyltransferase MocA